jgi:tetratricopeptide (TPR) repeat protein
LGNIERDRRAYPDAFRIYLDAERAACDAQYNYGLAAAIEGQAVVLWYTGQRDDALTLFKRQEDILIGLKDYPQELAFCLYNQAIVRKEQGKLQEALELHQREAEQYRRMNHFEWLAGCLDMQADLLAGLGKSKDAERTRAEARGVRRQQQVT